MSRVTILDGGMSRELMRVGAPFRQPEWSALALLESPDHVRRAHEEFARAGAEVLTTNAYALVPFHLGEQRFASDGRRLAALAGELARSVADVFDTEVAGCLPPALGSYRPETFDAGTARPILDVLVDAQAPFVDVWLAETMSSVDEASTTAEAVRAGGSTAPVWLAFTTDDRDGSHLRSGESVDDAVLLAESVGAAVLAFNCSQPEALDVAVRRATGLTSLPIGVYANVLHDHGPAGANDTIHQTRVDATAEAYCRWTDRWIEMGAAVVGGCCGTDATHIAAVTAHVCG